MPTSRQPECIRTPGRIEPLMFVPLQHHREYLRQPNPGNRGQLHNPRLIVKSMSLFAPNIVP
jgi:hypothetical protein